MSKLELVEATLEKFGFSFYVVNLPEDNIEDKLAIASPETGLISRVEFQNSLFSELVVNLDRLYHFLVENTGGDPDEQIKIRDLIEAEIYKINPALHPEGLVLSPNGVIKLKGNGEGVPLIETPDWDRIPEDEINPYVAVEEITIVEVPPEDIMSALGVEGPTLDRFDTVDVKWKRTNIDLKIRKFSKDDLPFIFGPDVAFAKELHFRIHVIQKCIEKAESVFALCDAMGITQEVKIPMLAEELYLLCLEVNPFLNSKDVNLEDLKKPRPRLGSGKQGRSPMIKGKKDKGKQFSEVTKPELLSLAKRMKAKIVGQEEPIDKIVDTIQIASCGLRDTEKPIASYLMCGATGIGKCHGKGTKVKMFDGSTRNVEEVAEGDLLMGDDSEPRRVLSLARGRDDMFSVVPNKGEPFTCNKSHILSLKHTTTGEVVNISVEDYLKTSKNFKHLHKLYRVPVDYPSKNILIDPYFVGLWLGDGHRDAPAVTTADVEIVDYLDSLAASERMLLRKAVLKDNARASYYITSGSRGGSHERNQVLNKMRLYGLLSGDSLKFIPKDLLINDRATRLSVLAGLVDSDGYLINCTYELIFKDKRLANDTVELARSLGFGSTIREKEVDGGIYHRIFVSGNLEEIPVKLGRKKAPPRKQIKDVLRTGFKLEYLGRGDYYGFSITGNRLYLLKDFTVTHNTLTAKVLAEELCGSRDNIVRIDCSEYTQQHDVQKLLGAPPSYVGYEDGGFLTNAVQENPFCVVLFDEIEKAHSKLFDLLLQIMDDARLTDGKGNVTDFKNCIVLMTSNIGVSESEAVKNTMGFGDAGVLTEDRRGEALKVALKSRFRPEFLNRIDETLSFRTLDRDDALGVIDLLLAIVTGYLANKNITGEFTANVKKMVFDKGFSKKYGARPLQRTIDKEVIKPLAKLLLMEELREGTSVKVDFKKGKLVVKELKKRPTRKRSQTTIVKA